MAESPHGLMPEHLIDKGMRRPAFEWVQAQPWPAHWKLQVWAGWRLTTKSLFDRGEYDTLAASAKGER